MAQDSASVGLHGVLTEDDVPGSSLSEPMEEQNVLALKWWLLCYDVEVASNIRKKQLLDQ